MRIPYSLITNLPALFSGLITLGLGFINFLSTNFEKNQQQLADQKEKLTMLLEKSHTQMDSLERIRSEVVLSKQQTLAVVHTGASHADQNLILLLIISGLIIGTIVFVYTKQDDNAESIINGVAKNFDISFSNTKASNIEMLNFTNTKCNKILEDVANLEVQILKNMKDIELILNRLEDSINTVGMVNPAPTADINALADFVAQHEQPIAQIQKILYGTL